MSALGGKRMPAARRADHRGHPQPGARSDDDPVAIGQTRRAPAAGKRCRTAGRGDEFIACFAEQVEFWMPGSTPISGRWHDRAGFIAYAMKVWSYLEVPVRLEVDGVIAAGEWVVTPCRGHGVTKRGEDYDNVYCLLWRVRDGLIVSFVEYCDTALINATLCR